MGAGDAVGAFDVRLMKIPLVIGHHKQFPQSAMILAHLPYAHAVRQPMDQSCEARIVQQGLARVLDQYAHVVVAPAGDELTDQCFYRGGVEVVGVEQGREQQELALRLLKYPGDRGARLLVCLQALMNRFGFRYVAV